MRQDKSNTIINIFLLILFLIIIAFIFYLLYNRYLADQLQDALQQNNVTVVNDPTASENPDNPDVITNPSDHDSQMATFAYSYPAGWKVEENVEAEFTTIRTAGDDNAVTIRVAKKADSLKELSLEEYAKVAAGNEIQGFEELISTEKIVTEYEDIGYVAIWKISFLGGEEFESNPITYFEHPFDPSKSIQVNLENANYLSEYNLIINSFEIK